MISDKLMQDLNNSFKSIMQELGKEVDKMKKDLSPEDLAKFKRHEKRVTENAKNGIITPLK